MIHIRRVRADEWQCVRDLRLKALADSPDSFRQTLAEALTHPDSQWIQSTALGAASPDRALFVAELDSRLVGTSLVLSRSSDPSDADLFAMWVDPTTRRTGIGRTLVEAAVEWAQSKALARLYLSVTKTNEPAAHLYRSAGFRDTGQDEPIRPGSPLLATIMVLELPRSAATQSAADHRPHR